MKRIVEYTAALIRLLGIYLLASAIVESVDFSVSIPSHVITTYHSSLHFLGFDVLLDGHAGTVILFFLKMSFGTVFVWHAIWLARLFWLGISPEVRPPFRRHYRNEAEEEAETDIWSDPR